MKKNKLLLSSLNIKSFITHLNINQSVTLKGGTDTATFVLGECNNDDSSLDTMCSDLINGCNSENSVGVRCTHTQNIDCVGPDTQQNTVVNCSNIC
ncbi:MAG: pinensin family lanthipeptide [Cyclobacteriaceae bacterium]